MSLEAPGESASPSSASGGALLTGQQPLLPSSHLSPPRIHQGPLPRAARATSPLGVPPSHIDNAPLPHKMMYSGDQDVGMVGGHYTAPHTGPQVGCTGHGEGHLPQGAMGSVNTGQITWPCPTSIRTFGAGGRDPILGRRRAHIKRPDVQTHQTPPHVWFLTCSQTSSWLTSVAAVIQGRPVCKV